MIQGRRTDIVSESVNERERAQQLHLSAMVSVTSRASDPAQLSRRAPPEGVFRRRKRSGSGIIAEGEQNVEVDVLAVA